MNRLLVGMMFTLLFLGGCASQHVSAPIKYDIAVSSDAERIAYQSCGQGETTLLFVHGWSCDGRYWQEQLEAFSDQYHVVAIDLAGHGHSSMNRSDYTMVSFAEDIKAVIEKEDLQQVVLIGHSLGGGVIAEAARLMPQEVIAIIGIDTLHNVADVQPQEVIDGMIAPFAVDFPKAMDAFVAPMFPEGTDEKLVDWVVQDMSSAPPSVAISAFRNYTEQYVTGEACEVFKEVNVPVVSINARLWPSDPEVNKKHMQSYRLFYIEDTGHFPMLERPAEFNRVLAEVLEQIGAL